MSPLTHLVGSWLIAVATTDNPRDRKLVTWAGVLPDADGLGVIPDVVGSWFQAKNAHSIFTKRITTCCCMAGPERSVFRFCSRYGRGGNGGFCFCACLHSTFICFATWLTRVARPLAICGRSATPSRCFAIQSGFGSINGNSTAGKTKPFSSSC